jgi:UPF0755 protein
MKGFARVVVVVLVLVSLVVGFAGVTAALDVFQPANKHITTQVKFEIKAGDTTNSVALRLQDDGLIRSALLFRAWARYRKLDRGLEPGTYLLSPDMTMDAIVKKLQVGKPDEILVVIPDGLRATQYPKYFTKLANFSAKDFLTTAKTGIEPNGTKLWEKYWFIAQPGANVSYALEGYLYPDGYNFFASATTTDVIEKMVQSFGENLCPGPATKPDAFITDAAACRKNAAQINNKNIFDLMRAAYPDATTDTQALTDALIISSFAVREINNGKDLPGVASVYHNRYLNIETQGTADTGYKMGSDPSVEYARDTETPPTTKWWADLGGDGNTIAPDNAYNTYTQQGMPPGAIANPDWTELQGGIAPVDSANLYFVSDKCGAMHYATNYNDFQNTVLPAMSTGNC